MHRASSSASCAARRVQAASPSVDGAASVEITTVSVAPGPSVARRVPACRCSSSASSPRSRSRASAKPRYQVCSARASAPGARIATGAAPAKATTRRPPVTTGDFHAPAVAAGGGVVVAIVHQGAEREGQRAGGPDHSIGQVGRVRAGLHPHALLEQRVGARVESTPAWCRRAGTVRGRGSPAGRRRRRRQQLVESACVRRRRTRRPLRAWRPPGCGPAGAAARRRAARGSGGSGCPPPCRTRSRRDHWCTATRDARLSPGLRRSRGPSRAG